MSEEDGVTATANGTEEDAASVEAPSVDATTDDATTTHQADVSMTEESNNTSFTAETPTGMHTHSPSMYFN